jgi:glycosyltransferase involved in cell wall biosynthesis
MMKIMFFLRDLAIGGSQRQLALLAAGLARRGHDVTVAVFYAGGALEAMLGGSGVRLLATGKTSRWQIAAPLARLRRLFVRERPDLVYAFLPTQTTLAALLLPRALGTKLVFGLRAGGMQLNRYGALEALTYRCEAWLSSRADLIIANARSVRTDAVARGLPAERIVVVPNGIDSEAMRPDEAAGRALRRAWQIADDAFVIGCVARLDPMKDHPTFLAAAAQFAQSHPDARFVCAGDGPANYREELKAQARSLGLDSRVIWAGEVTDVKAAYNVFDVATLSSAFGEGFPNVLGEAMACGVPVIATDVGDASVVVGRYGEVVPPNNATQLCEGWTRLRQRLAHDNASPEAARRFIAANFSVDVMVRRTEDVLSALNAGCAPNEIAREFS